MVTIIEGKVSVASCVLKMHVVAGQMVNLSGSVSMKHLCLVGWLMKDNLGRTRHIKPLVESKTEKKWWVTKSSAIWIFNFLEQSQKNGSTGKLQKTMERLSNAQLLHTHAKPASFKGRNSHRKLPRQAAVHTGEISLSCIAAQMPANQL